MAKRKLQRRKPISKDSWKNGQRNKKFKGGTKESKENFMNTKRNNNKNNKNQSQKSKKEYRFEEVSQSPKGMDGGFPSLNSDSDSGLEQDTQIMIREQNRKKKKSGGFQSMGLSHPVFKAIIRKGYKVPTPIQRKTIPLIMDGKDVVAMARTGSGKTAAFLIPMFERLKTHKSSGARALILSPTRELALQTLKFIKELGRYTGLKSAVILGGDSMEEQFAALHQNPDIIIATPGRFMHVLVEMELKLHSVEYVVFDEADRLFELGFQEQLGEILQRLPESRQTLLFSATLPKLLVDFAKAGLTEPTLIRLDVDTKLSENLKLIFLQCRSDDKLPILLHLLRNVIKPSEQTVIFTATKHHVEYLNLILTEAGFRCSFCYSALDPTARKINVAKFRNRTTMILLVTDLAARGIDIPLLDNVINYNFPAKSKLFVHRVGRVARAGSSGTAYSFVSPDELAYVLDLHLFLGRPMKLALVGKTYADADGLLGRVPQSVIDDEEEMIHHWKENHDIMSMEKVVENAYKHYIKSRPTASSESIKRVKDLNNTKLAYHPMFGVQSADLEEKRTELLENMRNFKPRGTIFEVNANKKAVAFNVMKKKREAHENIILRTNIASEEKKKLETASENPTDTGCEMSKESDINETFAYVFAPKPSSGTLIYKTRKKKERRNFRDEENYLNYKPKDFNTELGLNVDNAFEKEAAHASLDITGDDELEMRKQRNQLKWDRKRKKYVAATGMEPKRKKIKTESGQWISATYKTNAYKQWLEKSKVADRMDDEEHCSEEEGQDMKWKSSLKMEVYGNKKTTADGFPKGKLPPAMEKRFKGGKKELKTKEQILKERMRKEKLRNFMKQQERRRQKRKHSSK